MVSVPSAWPLWKLQFAGWLYGGWGVGGGVRSPSRDGPNHDLWKGTVTHATKEDSVFDHWPCLKESAPGQEFAFASTRSQSHSAIKYTVNTGQLLYNLIFPKDVSYAHEGCIYLIKNTVKIEILYFKNMVFYFLF